MNTAARIEPLNKEVHSRTLISHDVFHEIPSEHALKAHLRYVGKFALIGKVESMRAYELRDEAMDDAVHAQWHSMMAMVDAGDFVKAMAATDATRTGPAPFSQRTQAEAKSTPFSPTAPSRRPLERS